MLSPPKFWQKRKEENSVFVYLLLPLSYLYILISSIRHFIISPKSLDIPVICVGNITMGGTGKTPITMTIANILIKNGEKPAILSRGYKGKYKHPLRVNKHEHNAHIVGDEALMMAQKYNVYVGIDRRITAHMAKKDGATIIIMDDGMQNPKLHKDFTFSVVDANVGFGNERVFPAGPLRQLPNTSLKNCESIIVTGEEITRPDIHNFLKHAKANNKYILHAHFVTEYFEPCRVLAFCGIGNSHKFFTSIENHGCDIIIKQPFNDHHSYTEKEAQNLLNIAQENELTLITTEKDMMRLKHQHPNTALFDLAQKTKVLHGKSSFDSIDTLQQILQRYSISRTK